MKIIEALKKTQYLTKKVIDLKGKIYVGAADTELDIPLYTNQKEKVSEWLQATQDILLEIETIKHRIQKTNVLTEVSIELGGKIVTKSISRWIMRRRDLATMQKDAWMALTDRGLKPQASRQTNSDKIKHYLVRRYYDQEMKDKMVGLLDAEPTIIDGKLEIINVITDLLE